MAFDAERVQAVFAKIIAAEGVDRMAILDRECGADLELRRRIDALLLAHVDPATIFTQPVRSAEGATTDEKGDAPHSDSKPPDEQSHVLTFLQPATKPGSLGRLGHYEVLEVVGRGGFGIVLRAFDERLERVVALKVLSPEIAVTSPARKRFLREARTAAAVRHENIVQIYAVEEHPIPFLVMEFIPGRTLQRQLDDQGPLETKEMLRLAVQISRGVAAAHALGLIHRDIKPGNILLEGDNEFRVKITDFGLARAADDASLTQSGVVAGTPMYMSPEQAQGTHLDQRADLFSMGSVFYVMLSGRPPFRAPTTLAVLKRVAEETPRPIPEIIPEAPKWLCDIIRKLHAKNPDDRFQTSQEVADMLEETLEKLKTDGTLPQPISFSENRPTARKIPWWVIAAGVLILPALLITLPYLGKNQNSPNGGSRLAGTPPGPERNYPPKVIADPGPQFLDSRAYLPISESETRKVIDFEEIHLAAPKTVVSWLEALSPGFLPIVIGDHADVGPPRMHALAVKLAGRPLEWKCAYLPFRDYQPVTEKWNKDGYHTLQMQYADDPGEGMHAFLLWVLDRGFSSGYLVRPNRDLDHFLKQTRDAGCKPYLFVPGYRPNPSLFQLHSRNDYGSREWRVAQDLTLQQLAKFATDAKAQKLFLSSISAYRNSQGQTLFGAVAWQNPAGLDVVFKTDMTTTEYEAELQNQKQQGMRPVSVTSYSDNGITRFVASWVRYRTP